MPTLQADPEHLYRAFANLVLNAIEAMPEGGDLRLTCRPVPRTLFTFAVSAAESTRYDRRHQAAALDQYAIHIEVGIHDTGAGIPNHQINLLFTPFYTTKPRGTGLGLALTHKIIEEHRGSIRLSSQVRQGTTVTVVLPASK